MKRAIVIVIDALGVGALPDAPLYGDTFECNTLGNVAKANGGLRLPNLGRMGLGNIITIEGVPAVADATASYGKMMERSRGKDTTTGHWELTGLILDEPFRVYPNGFPPEVINAFIQESGCGGVLGNRPASGTEIIEELDAEHKRTGYPIVYTSADSVFQIACNTRIVPLEKLYAWCEVAREILNRLSADHNVSRVIARPYKDGEKGPQRINSARHDYAVVPPKDTVLDAILNAGGRTVAVGKIVDIFVGKGISHAVKTGCNREGLERTLEAIRGEIDLDGIRLEASHTAVQNSREFIFTNLVDTDALYGHRNDAKGYAQALEEIDRYLPLLIDPLGPDDLLIITGDHGCDPTVPGTDHTREYVPLLVYNRELLPTNLGTLPSFRHVADRVAEWLGIQQSTL